MVSTDSTAPGGAGFRSVSDACRISRKERWNGQFAVGEPAPASAAGGDRCRGCFAGPGGGYRTFMSRLRSSVTVSDRTATENTSSARMAGVMVSAGQPQVMQKVAFSPR